jgi:superfamily I DNA/RNA helicase
MTVNATICGVEIRGMKIMQAGYAGFDIHHRKRFTAGTEIAFKHVSSLNAAQCTAIFGEGEKAYNLTICWPIQAAATAATVDEKPEAKPFKVDFTPSTYQEAILDALLNSEDHLLVEALAGSGKTSTLVWLLQEIATRNLTAGKRIIYLAFNKSIQEELSEKLAGTGVPAQTTHSFGFGCVKSRFGNAVNLNNRLLGDFFIRFICDDNGYRYTRQGFKAARKEAEYALRAPVMELVGYTKNMAIFPTFDKVWQFGDEQKEAISELLGIYEVEFDEKFTVEEVVDFACRLITGSLPTPGDKLVEITFDDMLYLPLCLNLPVPSYDLVLTDESQDFNRCQILIIEKMVHAGRKVA